MNERGGGGRRGSSPKGAGDGHAHGRVGGAAARLGESARGLSESASRRAESAGHRIGEPLAARLPSSRSIGSPILFSIIWTSLASSVYFSLGVVAKHAEGLTPLVYLIAGLFFALTAMTYVEGASLHQERGGSTVFARHAFNELVSFVAGWAILLDYIILIAVTAYAAAHYLAAYWSPLGHHGRVAVSLAIIVYVAVRNIRGFSPDRWRRIMAMVTLDIALQLLVVVLGLILFFDPSVLANHIHFGSAPSWRGMIFALTIAAVGFTSLESASGLAGEVSISRRGLKRLIGSSGLSVTIVYVGIALVAVTALPVSHGYTPLGDTHRYLNAPVLGVISRVHPSWVHSTLKYVIAAAAALTLIAAANSAMLGLSRLAYSLSTNRQIPSAVGRLHPRRSTPFVLIGIAALAAAVLTTIEDLDQLVGIYAFGAMLAFTIAHVSVCRLRYREPDRDRPYRMPLSLRVRGGELPLPAVLGAVVSLAGLVGVMIVHAGARYVGLAWVLGGLLLYVIYRKAEGKSLLSRFTVAPEVLKAEPAAEADYGSILVPLLGTPIDDDLIQTAGRLVAGEQTDEAALDQATIEAVWIMEIPMSLPLDARIPDAQYQRARAALKHARLVGEEFDGVEVATAIVRARRAGHAIVDEARRRGVEAIVLGADEPSRIRGGARLGGRGAPLENFVGDTIKYVISKAPCRVIVTAPPAGDPRAHELGKPPGEHQPSERAGAH
ncbi:MAG TPA: amino acid permease [Solirubrobacteraceae bacterium]|jgi:APA family basic amino acid/polyamine antiporter|nr:amino acid permease [Solirubrobacteraceae bacterium]